MDKEKAEKIIDKMRMNNSIKKAQRGFFVINLFICGFAIIFYHNLIYVIILLSLALFDIVATVICTNRKSKDMWLSVLLVIDTVTLCIYFNCMVFSMSKSENCFVLWEYLFSILLQLLSLLLSCIFVPKLAEKNIFSTKEAHKSGVIGAISAMLTCSASSLCFRIFSPSQQVLISILSVAVNIACCALFMAIVVWCYKIHLMLKYDIR